MQITSLWFYFLIMPLFLLVAWALGLLVPFFRNLSAQERSAGRQPSLDGLRGILATAVFFLHSVEDYTGRLSGHMREAGTTAYAQFGVLPVTMFFFITGYVFWTKLLKTPKVDAGPFMLGRLGRLGGAYGLACLLLFALTAVASGFHRNVSVPLLLIQCLAWLSFLGSGHEINHIQAPQVWMGPAWTLQFEWYFYLSLPFFGWFAHRRARLPILLGGAAIMAFLLGSLHRTGAAARIIELFRSYSLFLACMFGVGMAVAALRPSPKARAIAQSTSATLVALGMVALTVLYVPAQYGYLESLMLVLPFVCICFGNNCFGLLTSEPVLFLGRISYSFYLLHVLVLAAMGMAADDWINLTKGGPVFWWTFAAATGMVSILVAAASYRYLEFPFLHVGKPRRVKISEPAQQFAAS